MSFARSGDSPESVAATELADQVLGEVHHLLLTCNHQGRLAVGHNGRERSLVWLLPEGAHDRSFAMTSSFTSMALAAMLALGGAVPEAEVEALAVAAEDLLNAQTEVIQSVALHQPGRVVYLGSGSLTALARESALKMLEMTAGEVMAISDSSLGFRHGP